MRFPPALALALALAPAPLFAQLGTVQSATADLTGYQEVPAVSTDATGTFRMVTNLSASGITVTYGLVYQNLSVPGSVTSVTIHFAQENVNGGTLITLCSNTGGRPCPQNGKLSGTIAPTDLKTVTGQNVAFDDFDKFLRALFAGKLYVQITTTRVATGELRGQIKPDAFQ